MLGFNKDKERQKQDVPNNKLSQEEFAVVLKELDSRMSSIETEPTKYTELGTRLYPEQNRGLHFATELSDLDEVSDIDRLETWHTFAPLVFIPKGITEESAKRIQNTIDKIQDMVLIHLLNKTGYKRRRSLEFVHAVKQDVGIPATEKSVNTMLKGGK